MELFFLTVSDNALNGRVMEVSDKLFEGFIKFNTFQALEIFL